MRSDRKSAVVAERLLALYRPLGYGVKHQLRFEIDEQAWTLRRVRGLAKRHKADGLCKSVTREILIDAGIDGAEYVEVLCHEFVHAAEYSLGIDLGEDAVTDIGEVLAQALCSIRQR